jgi:periplasmic protein TonB
MLRPVSACQASISSPCERSFFMTDRGAMLVSVILALVLHLAVFFFWTLQPPGQVAPINEMVVRLKTKPDSPPESPPKPRLSVSAAVQQPQVAKETLQLVKIPVEAEDKSHVLPLDQPAEVAQAAARTQITAVLPRAAVQSEIKQPALLLPDEEPDYKASYLNNQYPAYPQMARRMGLQGWVVLNVEVLAEGISGQVAVLQSSGHEVLDNAALRAVKAWRFVPARHAGRSISRWFKVPIKFSLNGEA